MRPWIRKHRIGALFLAALSLAGIGGMLVFCYFNFCFTLRWASTRGSGQSSRRAMAADYVYRDSLRSITPLPEA